SGRGSPGASDNRSAPRTPHPPHSPPCPPAVRGLRRALQTAHGQTNLETLLERLRQTPDNAAFLRLIQPTLPTG
ncbi:transcription termination factor Rho, partial [Streptomyces sp. NPDC012616]